MHPSQFNWKLRACNPNTNFSPWCTKCMARISIKPLPVEFSHRPVKGVSNHSLYEPLPVQFSRRPVSNPSLSFASRTQYLEGSISGISDSLGSLLWISLFSSPTVRLGVLFTAPDVAHMSLLVSDPRLLLPSAPVLGGCLGDWYTCKCCLPSLDLAGWDRFSVRLLAAITFDVPR